MISLAAEGKTDTEIMCNLHVTPGAWRRWMADHEEFREVHDLCKHIERGWWEDQGRKGIANKGFNSYLYAIMMINRFQYVAKRNAEPGNLKREQAMEKLTDADTSKLDHLFAGGDGSSPPEKDVSDLIK